MMARDKTEGRHTGPASATRNGIISLDVAIIGGGIAGLATAVALRQGGHRVTVESTILAGNWEPYRMTLLLGIRTVKVL